MDIYFDIDDALLDYGPHNTSKFAGRLARLCSVYRADGWYPDPRDIKTFDTRLMVFNKNVGKFQYRVTFTR